MIVLWAVVQLELRVSVREETLLELNWTMDISKLQKNELKIAIKRTAPFNGC